MLTGFNTDVEYEGIIYHVQTEDTGERSQMIVSQVFAGGAVLASKRSPYGREAVSPEDSAVAEKLKRQHKAICAAIRTGRIEEIKQMGRRDASVPPLSEEARSAATVFDSGIAPEVIAGAETVHLPVSSDGENRDPGRETSTEVPKPPFDALVAGIPETPVPETGVPDALLHISLMEEQELRAGEIVTLRIRVSSGSEEDRLAVKNLLVTLKIMGTAFRPLVQSEATDNEGIAVMHLWLPHFTSGRAVMLASAVFGNNQAELRRLITKADE